MVIEILFSVNGWRGHEWVVWGHFASGGRFYQRMLWQKCHIRNIFASPGYVHTTCAYIQLQKDLKKQSITKAWTGHCRIVVNYHIAYGSDTYAFCFLIKAHKKKFTDSKFLFEKCYVKDAFKQHATKAHKYCVLCIEITHIHSFPYKPKRSDWHVHACLVKSRMQPPAFISLHCGHFMIVGHKYAFIGLQR